MMFGTPEEREALGGRCRRNSTLQNLESLIERYNKEIADEQAKDCPNDDYIAARLRKIAEMRQTLTRAAQFDKGAQR